MTQLVVKEPVGVCAAFSPWNFPFNQAIRKISAEVGKQLSAEVGSFIKRSTMELSEDAPVIVCDAADGEAAVGPLVRYKYRNAWQVCISPTRFYVQERIYDRFVSAFVDRMGGIRVGEGLLPGTKMCPLAHAHPCRGWATSSRPPSLRIFRTTPAS